MYIRPGCLSNEMTGLMFIVMGEWTASNFKDIVDD